MSARWPAGEPARSPAKDTPSVSLEASRQDWAKDQPDSQTRPRRRSGLVHGGGGIRNPTPCTVPGPSGQRHLRPGFSGRFQPGRPLRALDTQRLARFPDLPTKDTVGRVPLDASTVADQNPCRFFGAVSEEIRFASGVLNRSKCLESYTASAPSSLVQEICISDC